MIAPWHDRLTFDNEKHGGGDDSVREMTVAIRDLIRRQDRACIKLQKVWERPRHLALLVVLNPGMVRGKPRFL